MDKKLSEMTLEELWELFHIFLTEYQTCWKDWYEEEACHLKELLKISQVVNISHIGSTAVETIWAKPIIDILVEMPEECDLVEVKEYLVQNGYICMSQKADRISLNKGYTENGFAERVFHLHLRYVGDNDELYFRDYLLEHADVAKEYEALKLDLWKKYEHNRDGYTAAKAEFVKKYTELAKQEAFVAFLIRAKQNTYAAHGAEVASSRTASHDLQYVEGDYMYYDTYLGGAKFSGEEAVWYRSHPRWCMNYSGRVIGGGFSGDFLKEALMQVPVSMPYRGPVLYENGEYRYECEVSGDIEWFQGYEEILKQGIKRLLF